MDKLEMFNQWIHLSFYSGRTFKRSYEQENPKNYFIHLRDCLLIVDNKGLSPWMEQLSNNSGAIWTYAIITITVLSMLKYFSKN